MYLNKLKKISIISAIVIIACLIFLLVRTNNAIEPLKIAESLINDVYNITNKTYNEIYDEYTSTDDVNVFKREEVFEKYFFEDEYLSFLDKNYSILYFRMLLVDANLSLDNLEMVEKTTSQDNERIIEFEATVLVDFLDELKDDTRVIQNGVVVFETSNEKWLVKNFTLHKFPFKEVIDFEIPAN